MESVIQQIRQSREDANKKRSNEYIKETEIDGCKVKITFNALGDSRVMPTIQSMLLSAHTDAAFAASPGGV